VARQTLQRLLAGQQRLSAEMALQLGRLCGNGPEIWLNLQAQYDLALPRERSAAQLAAVEPLVESVGQLSQNLNPGGSRVRIRDPVSGCLGRSS
jgi:plasmid maintenance system antidote protein VapI